MCSRVATPARELDDIHAHLADLVRDGRLRNAVTAEVPVRGAAAGAPASGRPGRGRQARDGAVTIPTLDATGKVVVVTGGSKGLGRAMALGFAEAGADVVVASRKLEPCEAVADEMRALGRRALPVRCHVGDWDQCAASDRRDRRRVRTHRRAGQQRGHRAGPAVAARRHARAVRQDDRGQPQGPAPAHRPRRRAHARGRSDHQRQLEGVAAPVVVHRRVRRGQGGAERAHAARRPRSTDRGASASTRSCAARSTPTACTRRSRRRSCRRRWPRGSRSGRIASADEIVGTALYLASDASSYLTGELILLDGG